ncbi:hypothetical protein ABT297_37895 [Dactylosporangium sp. NPDC000555]|uniref:AfsR/SARP family transcriptional regulator n=1 Tax=Dactylosporangium sp. NPDC000555 TaxID=3154260 RepID=UPI00332FDBD7
MRRFTRAAMAVGWLLLVLVGLPYGLVVLDRIALADLDGATLVTEPLTAPVLLLAGTVVGWVLWAWLLSVLVYEVSRRRRRRGPAGLRLAVPWHRPVSALAGMLVLLTDASAAYAIPPVSGPVTADAAPPTAATSSGSAVPTDATAESLIGERGITLGGGWLPLPAAAGVGAALTSLWRHGRRVYRPRPPGRAVREDPAPPTPPTLLAELSDAVAVADAPPVTIGADPQAWLGLADLPAGGVGLTGPGAVNAARAILATAVAAHLADSGAPAVIATVDDLQTLAGTTVAGPGLHTARDLPEMLDLASRYPADQSSALLLHVQPLPTDATTQLAATIETRPITAVLVGPWPPAQTWHVEADGTVHRPAGTIRLGVLNQPAAHAILAAVTEAHRITATQTPRLRDELESQHHGPTRLLLQVLGPVDVRTIYPDGSHSSARFRRTAAIKILAYLALHRDGATSDEIKEALWPDVASSLADRRFQVTMSHLRGVLQAAAGVPVLPTGQTRHHLDPATIHVDLWQLHDLLDQAAMNTDEHARRALLHDAIRLDHGELAEGIDADWLYTARESTVRHYIDVYCHLAAAEPDHQRAVDLLRRATRLAPDNEAIHRTLINRLDAAGDVESARRARDTLARHLSELYRRPRTVADAASPVAGAHR